jgi:hypothetical protein
MSSMDWWQQISWSRVPEFFDMEIYQKTANFILLHLCQISMSWKPDPGPEDFST